MIEVIVETNADWWTGRCYGSEGLFPSNYVEKLPPTALAPYHPPQPRPQAVGYPGNQYYTPPPNHYQITNQAGPFSPAPYGTGPPPPSPGTQQVVAPSEPQKPPKKNFLSGSLGNTVRRSLYDQGFVSPHSYLIESWPIRLLVASVLEQVCAISVILNSD